jgi:hypothetical protein
MAAIIVHSRSRAKRGILPVTIVPNFQYKFDPDLTAEEQAQIISVIEKAFESGEIVACQCPSIEAWVYRTRPPDFQAALSCSCDAMRPLFSSSPEER